MQPRVLIPWDREEATDLKHASWIARRSQETIRIWAGKHHLGRKVGGTWMVSLPALLMFLDGDAKALSAYLAGDRTSEVFRGYRTRAHTLSPPELT